MIVELIDSEIFFLIVSSFGARSLKKKTLI